MSIERNSGGAFEHLSPRTERDITRFRRPERQEWTMSDVSNCCMKCL